ncbi:MAG: alpha/beta hydrolase [Tetragenococcus sp.]|nr:alpha/beta hydrolase [Tetragenococcus sp.]
MKKKKIWIKGGILGLGLASYLLFKSEPETIVLKEAVPEKVTTTSLESVTQEDIYLIASDGLPLALTVIQPENQPVKAVVQVVHGLLEHRLRYSGLASFLARNGFAVILSDSRGHGDSIDEKNPLGQMPSVKRMLDDQLKITRFINEHFTNSPVYLYGHSYGSVLARLYLQKNDQKIAKLLMTGTVQYEKKAKYGVVIALLADLFAGKQNFSWVIKKLSNFGSTDKTWLTNDEVQVEKVLRDPRMLPGYNNIGVTTIWEGVRRLKDVSLFACQNPELPILSITGAEDVAITGGRKGLIDTQRTLRTIGYQNVEMINFPKMKHEVINEINQEQVYQTILDFFNR